MNIVEMNKNKAKTKIVYDRVGNYTKSYNKGSRTYTKTVSVADADIVRDTVRVPSKSATYYGQQYDIIYEGWDAEKSQGELGAPRDYEILHETLTVRGWQIYQDSDIAKMLVKGYVSWILGKGLNVQSEPIDDIIDIYGYKLDRDKFTTIAEARTRLHFRNRNSAHNRKDNLHKVGADALKSVIVGGDGLVIYRYNNGVTVEFVDGRHIRNPNREWYDSLPASHRIVHGVELNEAGEHIAYYIRQKNDKYKRVLARGRKTGRIQAVMLYGDEYRVDSVRGLPLFASSIEKLKKIDRYIEAVVSGTEERAKVAYQTVHNHLSDGSDPLARGILNEYTATNAIGEPETISLDTVNRQIFKTTNKMAINNPPGSEIKTLESTVELHVGPFLKDNLIYISASMGIPYEVAVMMYENSFSASRMASQSFQQTIENDRDAFVFNYYKPAYDIQVEMDILNGRLQAEGYLNSINHDDYLLREAYLNARFTGHSVPQADPSKEVKAVVLMLQNNLITHEEAAELLANNDFASTLKRLGKEYADIISTIPIQYQRPPNAETDKAEFTKEPNVDQK